VSSLVFPANDNVKFQKLRIFLIFRFFSESISYAKEKLTPSNNFTEINRSISLKNFYLA